MWRRPCTCRAWGRATVCFRKIAGRWLVVHEHASMPVSFNP
ncbi:nuclear transport factor 2 family protein [Cupriavidus basilensis]